MVAVSWIFLLFSLRSLPADKIAQAYDTIRVRFNLAVDNESVVPERFLVYKDSVLQAGSVVIDSVHADKKLYYLSGLRNIVTTDGQYEFRVICRRSNQNKVSSVSKPNLHSSR